MYLTFFERNNLLNDENKDFVFRITGKGGKTIDLQVKYENYEYRLYTTGIFSTDESLNTIQKDKVLYGRDGSTTTIPEKDIITKIELISPKKTTKDMSNKITFFDRPVAYGVFFEENNLFKYEGSGLDKNEIILTGQSGVSVSLRVNKGKIYYLHDETMYDLKEKYLTYSGKENKITNDIITSLKIKNYYSQKVILDANAQGTSGGRKASVKKEVCGKLRCIYKIAGSRKEHIKYKGQLIAVADYKKLMKKA